MPNPENPRILPRIQLSPGYIRLNPTIANERIPMAGTIRFLNRMFEQFFARDKPDSTVAKPSDMMNTKAAAIIIQRLFTVNISADTAGG